MQDTNDDEEQTMSSYIVTDPADDKRLRALLDSLFQNRGKGWLWSADNDPLVHRDWQKVWAASELGVLDFPLDDEPDWPARPGLPDITSYIDPLLWCLRDLGRTDVVLYVDVPLYTETRDVLNQPVFCRCKATLADIEAAEASLRPSYTYCSTTAIFDDTGDWLAFNGIEHNHFVAGTPAFIAQYYDSAGGEEYVRAWLYHWNTWHHTIWDRETGLPHESEMLSYDWVGWPYPVYPKTGLHGEQIDWSKTFGDKIKSRGPIEET